MITPKAKVKIIHIPPTAIMAGYAQRLFWDGRADESFEDPLTGAVLLPQNAALESLQKDIRAMPEPLKERAFDAVMLNPPWHGAKVPGSPNKSKDVANRLDTTMVVWVAAALTRTRPGGWVVLIQRAEWLPEILAALTARTGDISVLPLIARQGRPAKRVIVKARKTSAGPFRLAAPLILHEGREHTADGDDFTEGARAILRDGAAIEF